MPAGGCRAGLGLGLLAAVLLALGCPERAPAPPAPPRESAPAAREGPPPAPRPFAEAPRVVLVTIDTLRADHVGAYGGPVPTPALDALAAEGALVRGAVTPTPTTGPAHASLLTGLHPWRHGVLDNAVPLEPDVATLAQLVRDEGIAAVAFVSSYILHPRFGMARGFDLYEFEPSEAYFWRGKQRGAFWTRGEHTTEAALEWIGDHTDWPFLVWVHYFDPHTPYAPPAGYERPPDDPVSLEGKRLPEGVGSFAKLSELIRAYRGEVAYADAQIGRLVDGLRELGLLDEVALVVTSDHGEGLGDRGLLEHGAHLHDELVLVPLLVRAPGVPAGRRLDGPAQLEDLMPTVLRLFDLEVPAEIDGVDLLPWLRGDSEASPRAAAVGRRKLLRRRPDLFFQREAAWKWIGRPGRPGERYDLAADPAELAPTPGDAMPPPLAARLRAPGAGRAAAQDLDEESRRALEALGYLEQ